MNSVDTTIRPATAADIETVLTHRRAMFLDMGYAADQTGRMIERSRPFFTERLKSGDYRAWLIENERSEVVAGGGIVLLDYHTHPGESSMKRPVIVNVYTRPDYRRRGLARQLMDTMVDWCRQNGFPEVRLHASHDGRPLYEAMGFVPTNEMKLQL
jgi:GNAT superfamily N-acetyltransferase